MEEDMRELTIAEMQLVSGASPPSPVRPRIIFYPQPGPAPIILNPTVPDVPSEPDSGFGSDPDPMPD
jgi:hypothetical protein